MTSLIERMRAMFFPAPEGCEAVVVRVYVNGRLLYRERRCSTADGSIEGVCNTANNITGAKLGEARRKAKMRNSRHK